CIYQGEELGMTEAVLDFESLRDPYGIRFWPTFKGRDGCRTPMVWDNGNSYGGFSTSKPWLPIPPEHLHLAAENQEGNSQSLLEHYRQALAFRARHPELIKGDIAFVAESESVLVFDRTAGGSTIRVAINLGGEPTQIELDTEGFTQLQAPGPHGHVKEGGVELPPYGCWFANRTD
ncbi:MAG: DUF3459 domain-containing protein, partial [Novosphingobium sp.]|nr:DUF3459 domain-containing protein [Novosphingobium sp.]